MSSARPGEKTMVFGSTRHGGAGAAWLLAAVALHAGCPASQQTTDAASAAGLFRAPEGLAAHERYILVANAAFHYQGSQPVFGQGFVTLVDRQTRRVVGRVETSQPNPQRIAVVGDTAYVVNSGELRIENGLAVAVSDGGIDVLDLSGPAPPAAVAANIPLTRGKADRRIGAFGSIAVSDAGATAWLGSGTRGDVFKVDLAARQVLRGSDDPIVIRQVPAGENGMTVVRALPGDQLAILDFNGDRLCLADAADAELSQRRCHAVGVNDELLEGPLDVVAGADGQLLVLMSLANRVYRVDTAGAGPFAVDHDLASTGLSANALAHRQGALFVLNSLSNNLQRITLTNGVSALPFAVLPVGSNPYDLLLTEEPSGPLAWISLFNSDALAVVDLTRGEVIEIIGADGASDGGADASSDGGPPSCDGGGPELVGIASVVSASFGEGAGLGQDALPEVIQGGPHGGGERSGSAQSVLSLGVGGEIVVDFGAYEIVDGPGPDLIVFENAFVVSPFNSFAEPAIVGASVESSGDAAFVDFSCDLQQRSGDPESERWPFPGCAGVRPVLADVGGNCRSPIDPALAGGDAFDLAEIGLSHARYLRLRDAGISTSGDGSKGFDLDAVVLIHYQLRR